MPGSIQSAILIPKSCDAMGESIAGSTSTLIVLNKDTKTLTTNPTNPFAVLSGVSAGHLNVMRVSVPNGATMLDIANCWRGTDPTTPAKVRLFGNCGPRCENMDPTTKAKACWPVDYDSAFYNPPVSITPSSLNQAASIPWWRPLFNSVTGTHEFTLSNTVAMDNGTDKTGEFQTVNLFGCTEVICLVSQACATPTAAMAVGHFGM